LYLGRSISDKEFNQLIAATSAEAGSNETERAWVAGVILNRARTRFGKAETVTDVLYAKNQFSAVTGIKTDLYSKGPTEATAQSIYTAIITYLPSVGKKYLFFTAANLKAYGPSDDSTAIERLRKQPTSKTIGATIFSETNP
jgi:spore germination cell wall hydrolase CwlJ-like protein